MNPTAFHLRCDNKGFANRICALHHLSLRSSFSEVVNGGIAIGRSDAIGDKGGGCTQHLWWLHYTAMEHHQWRCFGSPILHSSCRPCPIFFLLFTCCTGCWV